ncbi:hypothetical protein Peur_053965 [Populus x canadensis]
MSGNDKSSGITGGAGAAKAPGSGSTEDGTMKAPGQDVRISREGFEKNPAGYFRDLQKK